MFVYTASVTKRRPDLNETRHLRVDSQLRVQCVVLLLLKLLLVNRSGMRQCQVSIEQKVQAKEQHAGGQHCSLANILME